jgi:hypothetical protein
VPIAYLGARVFLNRLLFGLMLSNEAYGPPIIELFIIQEVLEKEGGIKEALLMDKLKRGGFWLYRNINYR